MKKILLIVLLITGINADFYKWHKEHKNSCLQGDGNGCSSLAFDYEFGHGTKKDLHKSKKFYQKAMKLLLKECDKGNGNSCSFVANQYLFGNGTKRSKHKASKFYKKGLKIHTKNCNSGDGGACGVLGFIYKKGIYEVTQNYEKSLKFYKKQLELYSKSCAEGNAEHCYYLGGIYKQKDRGVTPDIIKVVKFFNKACDGGYIKGCYVLGKMYESGQNVKQNHEKAKQLFSKACDNGNSDGCKGYARLNPIRTISTGGPFGLNMGMSLEQIDPKAEKIAPNKFIIKHIPKPHSSFEQYIVKIGEETGLCYIKVIGKDISTSAHGVELKSNFKEMKEKLTKAYGKSKTSDFLMSDSIWDRPNYFMMSLIKKERVLSTLWENSQGSSLKNNLQSIILNANPIDTNKGYLSIDYYFSNSEICDKEISAKEDGSL